ncbi:MAG: hypothetical protein V3U67_03605, partial [Gemmatimonadota bacterium]
LIYIAASWVVLEAADVLVSRLALPEWVYGAAIVLLLVGLPIVLATAFIQEGLSAAPRHDPTLLPSAELESEARPRGVAGARRLFTWRNAITGGVVAFALWGVVAAGWLLLGPVPVPVGGPEDPGERKMLAVLPFENLGLPEDEYFADGMTEEIISRLAMVHGLGVISRTSAITYKNTDKPLRQIGEELGVEYVLEGTVRWEKPAEGGPSRVRITPQLVRVSDDTHLWADRYDRVLAGVFEIQTDIAEHVIQALEVALLEPERRGLEARPTENLEAYDYYLRGLTYARRRLRRIEDRRLAVEMFERAVELDPNYVEGYAALSRSYGTLFSDFGQVEAGPKAKEAVDRAMQLAPDRPETHMALGWYDLNVTGDVEVAEEHFAMARRGLPSNADLAALGRVQLRQGKWEHAVATYKEAVRLDPLRGPLVSLGRTYYMMRRYPEAEDYLNRSVTVRPDDHWAHFWKMMLYLTWDGGTERAQEALQAASQRADLLRFLLVNWDFDDRMVLRIFASHFADALNRRTLADPADSAAYYLAKADAAARNDRAVVAYAYYDSARFVLKPRLGAPYPSRHHSRLGIAYAGLSQAEEAIREGKKAFELAVASKNGQWSGSFSGPDLAEIYLMVGEYDAAIDQLERLLSMPSIISVPLLRFDPIWDPLRDHPRFQALLEREQ